MDEVGALEMTLQGVSEINPKLLVDRDRIEAGVRKSEAFESKSRQNNLVGPAWKSGISETIREAYSSAETNGLHAQRVEEGSLFRFDEDKERTTQNCKPLFPLFSCAFDGIHDGQLKCVVVALKTMLAPTSVPCFQEENLSSR
jgi:hypothetical protein